MKPLKVALIDKGHERDDVDEVINDMATRMLNGEDPEELLLEEGLEADYVMDLIEYASTQIKEVGEQIRKSVEELEDELNTKTDVEEEEYRD